MKYIARKLDVADVLEKKSCFLFGPRQCGKTSLIRETLPGAYVFDLLSGDAFRRLARNPGYIEEACVAPKPVVIDEIQKMPSLLDDVERDERHDWDIFCHDSAKHTPPPSP